MPPIKDDLRPIERKDENGAVPVTRKDVQEVMSAFEEFKSKNDERIKELETKGAADPLLEDQLKKINTKLDSYEGLSAKIAEQERKAAEIAKIEKRFDELESMLRRTTTMPHDQKLDRASVWAKAVVNAHTIGIPNLTADQQKALSDVAAEYKALNVGNDTQGGYLAPVEYVREIIKAVTEISPARQLARVRQTANKAIQIPKRTGQFAARRVHEMGPKTETTGLTFGLEELVAPEMYALVDITNDMLEDSAFDMQAEIQTEATEQFAVKEGAEFISGTGVNEMEGILVNTAVQETISGAAANVTADGIIRLKYGIKSAYTANGTYILNRATLGTVRTLKSEANQYIWTPGLANARPNTIDGDGYVEFPDMPIEGAGHFPVAYGDFRRAYTILDRIAMEMLRDPYTQATGGQVRFIFRRRCGGKVVLAEAIRKLKCASS